MVVATNERNLVRFFRINLALLCFLLLVILTSNCSRRAGPSIEVTTIPPADKGGEDAILDTISGRVNGGTGTQQVVLYARSGAWYVQPYADNPFTKIAADGTWTNATHLGTEYAALLVEPGF